MFFSPLVEMENNMVKWIAGGVAAFFASRYLLRLNNASSSINTRTSVNVHKVSLSGIEFKATVTLQNPNPIALKIQYPFVNILYKGVSLGTSAVKNEVINISRYGEQSFDLKIQSAGWLTLIQSLGTSLINRIRSGEKTEMEIVASTSTRVNSIPYQKEDLIKLSF
jgi:LEA14-like dessication related protein